MADCPYSLVQGAFITLLLGPELKKVTTCQLLWVHCCSSDLAGTGTQATLPGCPWNLIRDHSSAFSWHSLCISDPHPCPRSVPKPPSLGTADGAGSSGGRWRTDSLSSPHLSSTSVMPLTSAFLSRTGAVLGSLLSFPSWSGSFTVTVQMCCLCLFIRKPVRGVFRPQFGGASGSCSEVSWAEWDGLAPKLPSPYAIPCRFPVSGPIRPTSGQV